jgi:arylsulfatase
LKGANSDVRSIRPENWFNQSLTRTPATVDSSTSGVLVAGVERTNIAGNAVLAAGKHVIKYELAPMQRSREPAENAPSSWMEKQVAQGHIPKTEPFVFSGDEGADVGLDAETAVSDDYKQGDNSFTGTIVSVTIDVSPPMLSATEQKTLSDAEDVVQIAVD